MQRAGYSRQTLNVHTLPHRVLIVDDLDDIREPLALLLRLHGFDATTAKSGQDALGQLHAGLRPCVMLLDLRMPGMDGWAVWDRVQAEPEFMGIRVVVLSGDVAQQTRALEVGVHEFVLKPINDMAIFFAMLDRQCGRRSKRNERPFW